MSNGQIFWFAWCMFWAFLWITLGWFVFPFGNILFFLLSLFLAIPSFIRNY